MSDHPVSAKNALQEYFQKKREIIPKYNTEMVTIDGNIFWKSHLSINGITFKGDQLKTKKDAEKDVAIKALQYVRTKVDQFSTLNSRLLDLRRDSSSVEEPAATARPLFLERARASAPVEEAVEQDLANQLKSPDIFNISGDKNICIFVDMENKQKIIFELHKYKQLNIKIYGFITYTHHLANKIIESGILEDPRITIFRIPFIMTNGCDIALTFFVGRLIERLKIEACIIVSQDNFAPVVNECLNQMKRTFKIAGDRNICSTICINAESILEKIKIFLQHGSFEDPNL